MFARFRRLTLAGELLVLQLALIVVVVAAVGAVSLAQSEATFDRVEGRRVTALAEQLAWNPLVRGRLGKPAPGEVLAPLVHSTQAQSGVTSVTVADAEGRAVASTDPTLVGTPLPLVDGRTADDRSGWSGHIRVGGAQELAARAPVLGASPADRGSHLGTVMIGVAAPTVWQRLAGASSYLVLYLGIAVVLGVLGSWLLARRIKRQTLGMEPREIAGLAEHREAMLYGIAEGVIALDPALRVTLVNEVGRRLLDLPERCVGMSLTELGIEERLYDVLAGKDGQGGKGVPTGKSGSAGRREGPGTAGRDAGDAIAIRGGRVLVMNRMTVVKDGRSLGSVTTLRDRTELARLERELGSFRSTTELLRAQAHEFANQLHIISGLTQMDEPEEVLRYIRVLSGHRKSLGLQVTSRIDDTAVAALVMAKSSLAAERKVRLRLSERTALPRLGPADSADVATVTGNLVDNAIDAAAEGGGDEAWVEVELRHDASGVEIVVRDSGPGVAPGLAHEVFARGFTTKAARGGERGIGLALTQLVGTRRGGEVAVTNTDDGAVFTAHMPVGRLAHETMEAVR
ncbi:ATP-binding protein [Streptomyces sp. NPDC012623]|uniref:sensor histidine kinase n=1 Tax=unclassified Streptomyces TaxID=2593676 RepID=UPI0036AA8F3F